MLLFLESGVCSVLGFFISRICISEVWCHNVFIVTLSTLYRKRSFSSSVDTISHLNRLKIKEIFIRHSKCLNLPKQNKIFGKFLFSFKNVKYLRWIIYFSNIPVLLIQIPVLLIQIPVLLIQIPVLLIQMSVLLIQIPVLLIQMPRTKIFPDLSWQIFFYVSVTFLVRFRYIFNTIWLYFVTCSLNFCYHICYIFNIFSLPFQWNIRRSFDTIFVTVSSSFCYIFYNLFVIFLC